MFDVELQPNKVFDLFDAKLAELANRLNSAVEKLPALRLARPFRVENGLRFTGLSGELLEEVSTDSLQKDAVVHEQSLFAKAVGAVDKNLRFTDKKGPRFGRAAPRPAEQPVLAYRLRYRDKGLLRISGRVEAGLTRSRGFDSAVYEVDATVSNVTFEGVVRVFCADVERFLAERRGVRATLELSVADLDVAGSAAGAARLLRRLLRGAGRVELEV